MKTVAELNAFIPTLVEQIKNVELDLETGGYLWYDEDGWAFEISIDVDGYEEYDPGDYWTPPYHEEHIESACVREIIATHDDEDDYTEFSDDDVKDLWDALDKALAESL